MSMRASIERHFLIAIPVYRYLISMHMQPVPYQFLKPKILQCFWHIGQLAPFMLYNQLLAQEHVPNWTILVWCLALPFCCQSVRGRTCLLQPCGDVQLTAALAILAGSICITCPILYNLSLITSSRESHLIFITLLHGVWCTPGFHPLLPYLCSNVYTGLRLHTSPMNLVVQLIPSSMQTSLGIAIYAGRPSNLPYDRGVSVISGRYVT